MKRTTGEVRTISSSPAAQFLTLVLNTSSNVQKQHSDTSKSEPSKSSDKMSVSKRNTRQDTATKEALAFYSPAKSQKELYRCSYCSFQSPNRRKLKCHNKDKHKINGILNVKSSPMVGKDKKKVRFVNGILKKKSSLVLGKVTKNVRFETTKILQITIYCPLCTLSYPSEEALAKHVQSNHLNNGSRDVPKSKNKVVINEPADEDPRERLSRNAKAICMIQMENVNSFPKMMETQDIMVKTSKRLNVNTQDSSRKKDSTVKKNQSNDGASRKKKVSISKVIVKTPSGLIVEKQKMCTPLLDKPKSENMNGNNESDSENPKDPRERLSRNAKAICMIQMENVNAFPKMMETQDIMVTTPTILGVNNRDSSLKKDSPVKKVQTNGGVSKKKKVLISKVIFKTPSGSIIQKRKIRKPTLLKRRRKLERNAKAICVAQLRNKEKQPLYVIVTEMNNVKKKEPIPKSEEQSTNTRKGKEGTNDSVVASRGRHDRNAKAISMVHLQNENTSLNMKEEPVNDEINAKIGRNIVNYTPRGNLERKIDISSTKNIIQPLPGNIAPQAKNKSLVNASTRVSEEFRLKLRGAIEAFKVEPAKVESVEADENIMLDSTSKNNKTELCVDGNIVESSAVQDEYTSSTETKDSGKTFISASEELKLKLQRASEKFKARLDQNAKSKPLPDPQCTQDTVSHLQNTSTLPSNSSQNVQEDVKVDIDFAQNNNRNSSSIELSLGDSYPCQHCSKKYKSIKQLTRHVEKTHQVKDETFLQTADALMLDLESENPCKNKNDNELKVTEEPNNQILVDLIPKEFSNKESKIKLEGPSNQYTYAMEDHNLTGESKSVPTGTIGNSLLDMDEHTGDNNLVVYGWKYGNTWHEGEKETKSSDVSHSDASLPDLIQDTVKVLNDIAENQVKYENSIISSEISLEPDTTLMLMNELDELELSLPTNDMEDNIEDSKDAEKPISSTMGLIKEENTIKTSDEFSLEHETNYSSNLNDKKDNDNDTKNDAKLKSIAKNLATKEQAIKTSSGFSLEHDTNCSSSLNLKKHNKKDDKIKSITKTSLKRDKYSNSVTSSEFSLDHDNNCTSYFNDNENSTDDEKLKSLAQALIIDTSPTTYSSDIDTKYSTDDEKLKSIAKALIIEGNCSSYLSNKTDRKKGGKEDEKLKSIAKALIKKDKSIKKYKCTKCKNFETDVKGYLDVHKMAVHRQGGDRLRCKISKCNYRTPSVTDLERHMKHSHKISQLSLYFNSQTVQ